MLDERYAAFRSVIASAPDLDAQVPTCPGWTLFDLAAHIGEGRRSWASTVAAGPSGTGRVPFSGTPAAPREPEALVEWLAQSCQELLDALVETGPDRGCWSWWGDSQTPLTTGAVARHQLHEISMHTYDAQVAVGGPQPLPTQIAVDGVEEFLFTCCSTTTIAWPHEPATIDYEVTEGRSWRQHLSVEGSRITRNDGTESAAGVRIRGAASDLMLFLFDRISIETLVIDGDRKIVDQVTTWDWSA
nr:maleylpyruvate isomerase N-terminal domain-containing protein [Kineosporia mesophila]